MAETKAKKPTTKKTVVEDEVSEDEFTDTDLEKRVLVKNIAGWDVGFRLRETEGDALITKNSKRRFTRNEIQAQVYNGNNLFSGVDGKGGHATLYIEDAPTRRWLNFETKDEPQLVFTDDMVKKLFNMPDDTFKEMLPQYISTRAEKFALMETIERLRLNDFRKIMFCSEYTGHPIK
jgi:hypothetical protein